MFDNESIRKSWHLHYLRGRMTLSLFHQKTRDSQESLWKSPNEVTENRWWTAGGFRASTLGQGRGTGRRSVSFHAQENPRMNLLGWLWISNSSPHGETQKVAYHQRESLCSEWEFLSMGLILGSKWSQVGVGIKNFYSFLPLYQDKPIAGHCSQLQTI